MILALKIQKPLYLAWWGISETTRAARIVLYHWKHWSSLCRRRRRTLLVSLHVTDSLCLPLLSVDNDVTTAGLWCALRSFYSSFSCASQLLSVWEHNCVNSVLVYSLVCQCISKEFVRWQRIVVVSGHDERYCWKKKTSFFICDCFGFFNYFTFSSSEG